MATSTDSQVNPLRTSSVAPLEAAAVVRSEHQEDLVTRMLEHQTAKIPSNFFLMGACCAMAVSFAAQLAGNERGSRFIGMWVGPLLTMGVYNKLVKTLGPR